MTMIQYEVRDNVAEILFNHGPVNAITHEFMDEFLAALQRASQDTQVRAIIIASALPGRFCGGIDLGTVLKSSPATVHGLIEKLYAKLCLGAVSCLGITKGIRIFAFCWIEYRHPHALTPVLS